MKAGMLSGINIELSSTLLIWIGLRDRLGMYPQCLFSRMFLKSDQGRASTYLSTRAFLSTLLSRSPTLQTTSSSYPFMFPGVDILNHSRGQTVSWCTSYPEGSTEARDDPATISIISHITMPLGKEVFNNYGLKANLQPPIYLYFNRCVSYSRPAMSSLHNLWYSARTTVFSFLHHSCSFFERTVPHVKLSKHLISVACVYRSLRSSNEILTDQCIERACRIARGPHVMCHDNINISTSISVEQRVSEPVKVQSGTFAILYEVRNGNPAHMRLAPVLQRAQAASDLMFNTDVCPTYDQMASHHTQSLRDRPAWLCHSTCP